MIEVILRQDVPHLGVSGNLLKVKDGFARNYLIPKGLALPATEGNLKVVGEEKRRKQLLIEKQRREVEELAEKLEGMSCTIPAEVTPEEKLYGSVSELDIAKAIAEEGLVIEPQSIALESPIKNLGIYNVPLKLHPEITVNIRVWVVKK